MALTGPLYVIIGLLATPGTMLADGLRSTNRASVYSLPPDPASVLYGARSFPGLAWGPTQVFCLQARTPTPRRIIRVRVNFSRPQHQNLRPAGREPASETCRPRDIPRPFQPPRAGPGCRSLPF